MSENNKESMNKTGEKEIKKEGETKDKVSMENTTVTKKVSPSSISDSPVSLTSSELATLDYADFSTPARMLELGKVLAKSQLVPLKKPEDVVVALMTGKELGLPFVTSVSQIYPINGRPTLGVHIQKALLLSKGVVFTKIEDAVKIYSFVQTINGKLEEVLQDTIDKKPKESKMKFIGYRTTYKFNREILRPSGKYKEIEALGSFSTMEAATAELLKKEVWIKYYKRMLDARAFSIGAKEIADDLLLGILTPNELSNDFYINDKNEEVHIATPVANN